MPKQDGLQATRRIREVAPDTVIAVVTGHGDAEWISRAAQAGASAFIPKGGSLLEMIDMLQRVRPGQMIVAPSAFTLEPSRPSQPSCAPVPELTPRELEVLTYLGKGLSLHTIAQILGISLHTCRGYVKSSPATAALQSAPRPPGRSRASPSTTSASWSSRAKSTPVHAFLVTAELEASEPAARTPFVGRGPELAVLTDALDDALDGRGAIVSVTGEPGIGKSRLVREACGRAPGVRVLVGHALAYTEAIPYWPVRDLLRSWLGLGVSDPEGARPARAQGRPCRAERARPLSVPRDAAGADTRGVRGGAAAADLT